VILFTLPSLTTQDGSELTPETLNSLVKTSITAANSKAAGEDSVNSDISGDTSDSSLDSNDEDVEAVKLVRGEGDTAVRGQRRREEGYPEGQLLTRGEGIGIGENKQCDSESRLKPVGKTVNGGVEVKVNSARGKVQSTTVAAGDVKAALERDNGDKADTDGTKVNVNAKIDCTKTGAAKPNVDAAKGSVRTKVHGAEARVDSAEVMVDTARLDVKAQVDKVGASKAGVAKAEIDSAKVGGASLCGDGVAVADKADCTDIGTKAKAHVVKDCPKRVAKKDISVKVELNAEEQTSKGSTVADESSGGVVDSGVVRGGGMAMIGGISSDGDSDDDDEDNDLPINPKKISSRGAIKIKINQLTKDQAHDKQSSKLSTVRSQASKVTYVNLKSGSVAEDVGTEKATSKKSSSSNPDRSRSHSRSPSHKKGHSRSRHRSRSKSRQSRSRHRSRSRSRQGRYGSGRHRSVSRDSSRRSRRKRSR
jgi:hypothetical protein